MEGWGKAIFWHYGKVFPNLDLKLVSKGVGKLRYHGHEMFVRVPITSRGDLAARETKRLKP